MMTCGARLRITIPSIGDLIVSVNGVAVSGVEEFEKAVEAARSDGAARLRVQSSNGFRIAVLRFQK